MDPQGGQRRLHQGGRGRRPFALQVAIRAEVPVATLRNMPYAYPTFHRAIEDALKNLDEAEGFRSS